MRIPDALRRQMRAQGKSLNDSLGPGYYPKFPLSQSIGSTGFEQLKRENGGSLSDSLIEPLRAPWPHLPPLPKSDEKKDQRVPTSVRSFLDRHTTHSNHSV